MKPWSDLIELCPYLMEYCIGKLTAMTSAYPDFLKFQITLLSDILKF